METEHDQESSRHIAHYATDPATAGQLCRLPFFDVPVCGAPGNARRDFWLDIDEEAERGREAILNLIVRESIQFPGFLDYLYDNDILRSCEELMEWLGQQTRLGRIVVEDPVVCAGMLMDIVFGALLPRLRLRSRSDRTRRTGNIKKRVAIFLRGIEATD